ncbi:MAG: hypothetical protein U0325_28370 [Polyangiales bacterium]
MEGIVRLSWALLALLHLAPASVVVAPRMTARLYGVAPDGDVGVLLIHRGALFLAVVALCGLALVEPTARRAASLAVALSVVGFLGVYARAGMPPGALRAIARADLAGLAPLAVVVVDAWG